MATSVRIASTHIGLHSLRMCGGLLSFVFILLCLIVSTTTIPLSFIEDAKYEGTTCVLEDGLEGDCKKLLDCPSRIDEVKRNLRESNSTGRCGFDGFEEIVCCPRSPSNLAGPPAHSKKLSTRCTMKSGRVGSCTTLENCIDAFRQLEELIVNETTIETCGSPHLQSEGPEKIVCCFEGETDEVLTRSAERACLGFDYGDDFSEADAIEANSTEADSTEGRELFRLPSYIDDTITIPDNNTANYAGLMEPFPQIDSGGFSPLGQFPYMAALGYTNKEADNNSSPIEYNCGGSLISSRHVLTSAHCVSNLDEKVPVEVLLGTRFLWSQDRAEQKIPISNIITHPKYRRSQFYNDIAILKLKRTAMLTNTVKPICLDTKPLRPIYRWWSKISAVGWGATEHGSEQSSILMWTDNFRFLDGESCQKFFLDFGKLPHGINDNLLCVTSKRTEKLSDTCHGDSGGPLIAASAYSTTLIAITSFGRSCGTSVPGVYTAVYPYLDWIEGHVWPKNGSSQ